MIWITIVRALSRHWGKMVLLWLLLLAAVIGMTVATPAEYRSESKLFVRIGRENATLDPTATIGQGTVVALPSSRDYELNAVVDLLKSRATAEQVVDALGAEFFSDKPANSSTDARPSSESEEVEVGTLSLWWQRLNPLEGTPSRERALKAVSSHLAAGVVKKSNIINVTYESTSPEKAQKVLQTLVDVYLDEHLRLNRTPGAHEFVARQVRLLEHQLAVSEEELRTLKNQSAVASLADQRTLVEQRKSALQAEVLTVNRDLVASEAEVERLEAEMKKLPASLVTSEVAGHPNQSADFMRQQLYALELREQELLSKYTEEHFQMKQLRSQVAEARKILAEVEKVRSQTTTSTNPVHEQMQQKLASAKATQDALLAKAKRLEEQLASVGSETTELNDRALKIARLERDVAIQEANYRRYAENLEQTRLDEAVQAQQMTNVAVAQQPTLQLKAVRPKKLWNYLLGGLFATTASFALALVLELSDRSVRSADDIESELRIPALATIPRMPTSPELLGPRRPR